MIREQIRQFFEQLMVELAELEEAMGTVFLFHPKSD